MDDIMPDQPSFHEPVWFKTEGYAKDQVHVLAYWYCLLGRQNSFFKGPRTQMILNWIGKKDES